MLSYCWENQPTVLKIRDELIARNVKVWLDKTNVTEDIYDSMARGVRSSRVFVPCLSAAYSCSKNCLLEISFAIDERKKIVPLRLDNSLSDKLKLITSGLLCKYTACAPSESMISVGSRVYIWSLRTQTSCGRIA